MAVFLCAEFGYKKSFSVFVTFFNAKAKEQ